MVTPTAEDASRPGPPNETVRDGRYVVVGTLGVGSQGETLEAIDKREGRPVALKRFTLRGAKTWKDVELAEREARVLSSLSHPGLPRYIEHFEENGALYLVMEKVEGESLAARRKRGVALDSEQVLRFLRDAAACLRYLHGHTPPIVHRDIKPGNVILRPDGSYCLVDFGSVRDRLKPEGGSTVVGTFGFMAPEQFQGRAAPASDVYAVGATALCLISGQEPEDLPHKGLAIDVEGALRGQVDRRLTAALGRMLEPDPDRRAASVEAALASAGLGARPSADPQTRSGFAASAKQARRQRLEADGWSRGRESAPADHASEMAWRIEHEMSRRAQREERHAHKAAKRQTRRAKREARRIERLASHYAGGHFRPGPPVLPGRVLALVVMLALRLASVGTFMLFGVLLPLLFTIMYRPGRRQRMLEIGRKGQQGLQRARQHVLYQLAGGRLPDEIADFEAAAQQRASQSSRAATDTPGTERRRVATGPDATEPEPDFDAEPDSERHTARKL